MKHFHSGGFSSAVSEQMAINAIQQQLMDDVTSPTPSSQPQSLDQQILSSNQQQVNMSSNQQQQNIGQQPQQQSLASQQSDLQILNSTTLGLNASQSENLSPQVTLFSLSVQLFIMLVSFVQDLSTFWNFVKFALEFQKIRNCFLQERIPNILVYYIMSL